MSADEDRDDESFLISRIVAGEPELFSVLVGRHQKAVYNMGMSFFRNADDAADFAQEVFIRAFRSLERFQGRSRFSTWLYRIAYNTAINGVQRRKVYQSLAEDFELADLDTPERQALREAARVALREAVAELPERYRVCLDLYFFYERSYQEIEQVTGFPVNTIKSHVFRAKQLLRDRLGDLAEGGLE